MKDENKTLEKKQKVLEPACFVNELLHFPVLCQIVVVPCNSVAAKTSTHCDSITSGSLGAQVLQRTRCMNDIVAKCFMGSVRPRWD